MSGVQNGISFHSAHQTVSYTEYCATNWFRLQDYIEMHGQQNIKFVKFIFANFSDEQ